MKKLLTFILFIPVLAFAQSDSTQRELPPPVPWYKSISLRGFAQFRYNRFLETNPKLKFEAGDKSMGDGGGLFLRRVRLIFYGKLSERIYFLIHEDFASAASSGGLNFGQMRDAFMDIGIDKKNRIRLRLGQSKIPYGFENMQSSQFRAPLDRSDAINSGIPNEHDLAAIAYWTPSKIKDRYTEHSNDRMKGTGDYGVFSIGVFNGQTMNKPELNNEQHIVSRVAYPFKIGGQVFEPSIQAYTGHYVMASDQLSPGIKVKYDKSYLDQRAAISLVLFPKPFGIQAEYNIGQGPEFNRATDSIECKKLTGGYFILNYLCKYKTNIIIPFIRMQYYEGGKKNELDARSYKVHETEIGIEWLPIKNFGFTAQYTISNRRFEDYKLRDNTQSGKLLRLQAQVNF